MGLIPLREVGTLLRTTGQYWYDDRAPRMGAALAYYMALSLAPSLVIMLAIAGFAFSAKAAQGGLIWEIQRMVGPAGTRLIQTIVEGTHRSAHGFAATVVSGFTLFFGATAAVNELRDDLNTVWQVPVESTCSRARSLFNIIKDRVLSLAIVLCAGLYLLASLTLKLWVLAAERYLNPAAHPHRLLNGVAEWVISMAAITVLFVLLFKFMPEVKLAWSDVTIGAIFTSILFVAGRFVLSLYLGAAGFTDTYGAAGALVILLVWVYYSAQVLFLGAEFTRAYTGRFGSRASPLVTVA